MLSESEHVARIAAVSRHSPVRRATAHLIFGYLCSGKTTFARQLERDLRATRLTFDDFVAAATGLRPDPATFRTIHDNMLAVVNDLWSRLVANGCDVILDFGFWSRTQRDEARHQAWKIGAQARLYHVWCSEDVARARCEQRNSSPERKFDIPPARFEELKIKFEGLGTDEIHELVDTSP